MHPRFLLPFAFLIAFLNARATASAAPVDLGKGLLYRRVHALPADLPTSDPEKKSAVVLDLRYVATDDAGATALAAWLGFRTAAQPVFILVNAGTDAALIHALAAHPALPGVVVLGPALPVFTPDVTLKISPDLERRAYDAAEHGSTVESLIVEKADKPRYDEAELVKDHVSDSAPTTAENNSPDDPADAPAKKPVPPPPLIDLALQHALQLHRALLALRKIPRS
jgi:hypothetical protein